MKKKKVCSDEYHHYAYFPTIIQRKFWAGKYHSNVIQFSKMTIKGIIIKIELFMQDSSNTPDKTELLYLVYSI